MGLSRIAAFLLAVSGLAGCAVMQKPIPATSALFENKDRTVAVAMEKMPEPNQLMLGNQGLLDYAINKANAKAIVDRLQKQDFSIVSGLPKEFVKGLEARQMKVVLIEDPIDTEELPKFTDGSGEGMALRDYRSLAKKYNADNLLLVTARALGTVRSYFGFLPLSAPTGYIALTGQMVNLSTNRLEWYEKIDSAKPSDGEWDRAPEYENLMHAVDESTRAATSQLRGAFFLEKNASMTSPVAGNATAALAH